MSGIAVSYTHLRAHETKANLVCRLLLGDRNRLLGARNLELLCVYLLVPGNIGNTVSVSIMCDKLSGVYGSWVENWNFFVNPKQSRCE